MRKVDWALGALMIGLTLCPRALSALPPVGGPEFVVANGPEPTSLDPQLAQLSGDRRLALALFEGLITTDPRTGAPRPGLAQSWTVDAAAKKFTFTLRRAFWSDGTPIVAQDVVDSWQRSPEAPQVVCLASNPSTVVAVFSSPLPSLSILAQPAWAVVPVKWWKDHRDAVRGRSWVGNGPFVLESWSSRSQITLVPNPHYWDAASMRIARVRFVFDDDPRQALRRYLSHEADWLPEIPVDRWSDLQERRDFQVSAGLEIAFVRINLAPSASPGPLQDVRVRQALAWGVDRKEVIDRPGRLPLNSFTPALGGYSPVSLAANASQTYDPKPAQRLLAAAGYPGGKGFPSLRISFPTSEFHRETAQALSRVWYRTLGIDVQLEQQDWKDFFEHRQKQDFQLARGGWVADYADPLSFLSLWTSGNPNNATGFSDPTFDALVARAASTPAGSDRGATLAQAEARLVAAVPAIPLWSTQTAQLIDTKRWDGWWSNPANLHPLKNLVRKR